MCSGTNIENLLRFMFFLDLTFRFLVFIFGLAAPGWGSGNKEAACGNDLALM